MKNSRLLTIFIIVFVDLLGFSLILPLLPYYAEWIGNNGRELGYVQTNKITGHPQIFIGEEFMMNGITVVEAAARGRKAATNIWQFLNQMSN